MLKVAENSISATTVGDSNVCAPKMRNYFFSVLSNGLLIISLYIYFSAKVNIAIAILVKSKIIVFVF